MLKVQRSKSHKKILMFDLSHTSSLHPFNFSHHMANFFFLFFFPPSSRVPRALGVRICTSMPKSIIQVYIQPEGGGSSTAFLQQGLVNPMHSKDTVRSSRMYRGSYAFVIQRSFAVSRKVTLLR